MRRTIRSALLTVSAAALAFPIASQAAVTESTVTSPASPFYAVQNEDLAVVPVRITGTTNGTAGDTVDIKCYFDGTSNTIVSGYTLGASGAVDTNTLAAANRPDLTDFPSDTPCTLRIVPADFSGSLLVPYRGVTAAVTAWDPTATTVSVEGGPSINIDYRAEVPALRAFSDIWSAGGGGLTEMQGFIPGSAFTEFDEATWDQGAEIQRHDEDGGRASIIVDGAAAYLPATLPSFNYGSGVNRPIGSKGTSAVLSHDSTTGAVTITETSPVQRCNDSTDINPSPAQCTTAVATGVSLVRTTTVRPGGQVTSIVDRWRSTDGAAHNVRVEYYNEGGYDDYPLWKFPGDPSFRFYDEPATVFPGGPGTVLLRDNRVDGGSEMAPGALGYNPAPDFFYFTDYDYLPEVSTFAVPASGDHLVTRTFALGENSAEAAAIGARVEDEFVAPTVTITSPANGAVVGTPAVTVTGTAVDNQGVRSLTVNGAPTPVGAGGAFSAPVALAPGANLITVAATDGAGQTSTAQIAVTYAPAPAPVPTCGPTVHPAKLSVDRARVRKDDRRLDVLAPITGRASGDVKVEFLAAGRTEKFTVPVDSSNRRVRFNRSIPAAQANRGTGIMTLTYAGDADTQPQEVRLRAASRSAGLDAERPTLDGTRLRAKGKISSRARGVVRVQLVYTPLGGTPQTIERTATIKDGRYSLDEQLPADVATGIALRCGTLHSYTLFTGYLPARMRGEMKSYQVLPER